MPESKLIELAEGTGHKSFLVLAEWLKDNRESIERRLDKQDERLELIYAEARATNGKVRDLEKERELTKTLGISKKEWEQELKDEKEKAKDKREANVRFWRQAGLMGICTLFGGLGVGLGH